MVTSNEPLLLILKEIANLSKLDFFVNHVKFCGRSTNTVFCRDCDLNDLSSAIRCEHIKWGFSFFYDKTAEKPDIGCFDAQLSFLMKFYDHDLTFTYG